MVQPKDQKPVIFIDGEAGTTGIEIRTRLAAQPVDIVSLDDTRRKDLSARMEAMAASDLTILCLPDEAAREAVIYAQKLGDKAPRILDASTAHRTDPNWVYGFAELQHDQARKIASSPLVANPGCYPTGAIALLRPLIQAGILDPQAPRAIHAVSGYSGGGRKMIAQHERQGGPAFSVYGLNFAHKHIAEMMAYGLLKKRPVFVPSVGHFPRGMIVCIPLYREELREKVSNEELLHILGECYDHTRYVHVRHGEPTLSAEDMAGRDDMILRVHGTPKAEEILLTACLDNLGKGASGAAVQNMRLMMGMDRV